MVVGMGAAGRASGVLSALSKPLFTRTKKFFKRNRKGVLESTTEDTWSVSVADIVFIWIIIVAFKVLNDLKDEPPEKQADTLMGLFFAGPLGAMAGTLGLGPVQSNKKTYDFFRWVIDTVKSLPAVQARYCSVLVSTVSDTVSEMIPTALGLYPSIAIAYPEVSHLAEIYCIICLAPCDKEHELQDYPRITDEWEEVTGMEVWFG